MFDDKYNLTREQNIFLAKKKLVDNIYSSAKLEGINVTFPETQALLDGVNVGRIPLADVEKILNLRDAWKYTLSNIDGTLDLTLVKKVNYYVARNESLAWGTLRTGQVGISGTDYVPPIPDENSCTKKLDEILEQDTSHTEKAIDLFLWLCRAQLFWDGNKRTATIVANKLLISNGNGIFQIKERDLVEFNTKLSSYYTSGKTDDIKQFLYKNVIVGFTV